MKLELLTALAFPLVVAAAEVQYGVVPPELFGADQLSFLEAPCNDMGCAPNYCYPMYADADYDCYK